MPKCSSYSKFVQTSYRVLTVCTSQKFPNFYLKRNFSLVACYQLKFTHCLLITVKSFVSRCEICLLLVAEFVRHSLNKIARYSLQKLLVARNHSLLFAKFACYSLQKLLLPKNHSLLVAKFDLYLLLQKSIVAKNQWFLVVKLPRYSLQKTILHSLKQSPAGIIVCLNQQIQVKVLVFLI